ncbi:restriction endonuclease subunit S [Algibacter agarivorans]|uniref:Restriction endonuclease subunit S n=1 Tax=Algibacter agarivorans TaxID=1109741 RepID=A0ABP9GJ56_9FLAO
MSTATTHSNNKPSWRGGTTKQSANRIPKLRFNEFEGDWNTKKIGEIYRVNAGGDINENHVSQIKTEKYQYPIYANAKKEKGFYAYSDIYNVEPNTITISGRGAHLGIAHARDHRFYPIVRLLVLKPLNDEDIHFSECAINRLNLFIESTGVPQLTAPQISGYKISFPSLPEQQKIAAFLSAVDEKIQQLTKKKALLEQYKKGVMQQLFSGKLRFKDENGNPYPDWEEKRLGEVGKIVSGLTYSPDDINEEGVLVLRSSNVHGRQVTFDDNVYVNIVDNKFNPVEENDILICVRNGSKRLIGKNALIKGKAIGVAFGAFMTVYRSSSNLFLFHYFDTVDYKKEVHKNLGATINSINGSDLKKFMIPYPSQPEQQKIANYLSAIDKKIETVNTQIEKTQHFKKGLLQQLFV